MFSALDYSHVSVGSLAEGNLEYARLARVSQEEEIGESGSNVNAAFVLRCRVQILSLRRWRRRRKWQC